MENKIFTEEDIFNFNEWLYKNEYFGYKGLDDTSKRNLLKKYIQSFNIEQDETKSERERFQVESGVDHAGKYFSELHKEYTSKNKLVEFQQYKNTDSQLSYLWVDDKIVAFVIEARSAFNHVEVVKGIVECQNQS